MDQKHFDILIRSVCGLRSRRTVLGGLVGAGAGWGLARLPELAAAKKKRSPKRTNGLCRQNGSRCTKRRKQCRKEYCLRAPFTIEAKWTQTADHESYLFVPAQDATSGPFPFIDSVCNPDRMPCAGAFPFACVDHDEQQAGAETTTIHTLLKGTYEYWIELFSTTPADELTIVLKDGAGRVVRQWANPANPADKRVGWHVFNIDGNGGHVTSIDTLTDTRPPNAAHDPNTYLCPEV